MSLGELPVATLTASRTVTHAEEGAHVLWPDLVGSEGLATASGRRFDQVLSYIELAEMSPLQRTHVQVWRPAIDGWTDLGQVAISAVLTSKLDGRRWFGDYRNGTVIDAPNGVPRFLSVWPETPLRLPLTEKQARVHAAVVEL